MKFTSSDTDLGLREGPYVKTKSRGGGLTGVELSFYRQRRGPTRSHTAFHTVRFELTLDELACIGRTLIHAARDARTDIIEDVDAALDSLEEALTK